MNIIATDDMRRIDRAATDEYHIPAAILMEQAAENIWRVLLEHYSHIQSVVVIAGSGNNGGDGLAVAWRAHQAGWDTRIIMVSLRQDALSPLTAQQLVICQSLGIAIIDCEQHARTAYTAISRASNALIVDGLCGSGLRGELRPEYHQLVDAVNKSSATVVAIDVPSGIGDAYLPHYPAIHADRTLTIGAHTRALYYPEARRHSGMITLISIGFPQILLDEAEGPQLLTDSELSTIYPPLDRYAHKRQRGFVAVHGGSYGMCGAPILAADAAARCGAGLVMIYTDEECYPSTQVSRPSYLCYRNNAAPHHTAHAELFGPGWKQNDENRTALFAAINNGHRGVIDATAIRIINSALQSEHGTMNINRDIYNTRICADKWLITPHIGELAALLGVDKHEVVADPFLYGSRAAALLQTTVLLKSHISYIFDRHGTCAIFDGAHPAIGCAGSGDLLAGIAAAHIARGAHPTAAAHIATLAHHRAMVRCYTENGMFVAEQVPQYIGKVIAELNA